MVRGVRGPRATARQGGTAGERGQPRRHDGEGFSGGREISIDGGGATIGGRGGGLRRTAEESGAVGGEANDMEKGGEG